MVVTKRPSVFLPVINLLPDYSLVQTVVGFGNNRVNITQNNIFVFHRVEKTLGKGENAHFTVIVSVSFE